jgi:putative ABC transport system permease protein
MRLVLKNLARRRARTALSILGVAVGVGSIVAFSSMGEGFKRSINEYAQQTGADLIVVEYNVADPAFGRIPADVFEAIRKHPDVRAVGGSSALPATVEGRKAPLLVIGRDPAEPLLRTYRNPALRGRLLEAPDEILMGEILAAELEKSPGDEFRLFQRDFRIAGIYRTGVRWENGGVVVHMDAFRKAMKLPEGTAMAAFVFLRDPEAIERMILDLSVRFPHLRFLPASFLSSGFEQLAYIDAFIWVISLAALIVGAIGILNTMLMNVSERVREIGTLRAFGWTRAMVLRTILLEGLLTSLLGGVAGFGVGVAGAELLMRLVPQGVLAAAYSPGIFATGMAAAVAVGFAGALYPAWRASLLSPAEALRYE